jgi:hypothetical protein
MSQDLSRPPHSTALPPLRSNHGKGLRDSEVGQPAATSTARPRSNVITAADCYCVAGRGEGRGNAGVKHAEVVTARLVQDERGWLRLAG